MQCLPSSLGSTPNTHGVPSGAVSAYHEVARGSCLVTQFAFVVVALVVLSSVAFCSPRVVQLATSSHGPFEYRMAPTELSVSTSRAPFRANLPAWREELPIRTTPM